MPEYFQHIAPEAEEPQLETSANQPSPEQTQEERIRTLEVENESLQEERDRYWKMAHTDHKTELWNSRGWEYHLSERSAGRGNKLFLAILDLDDFGQINNTYGHEAGDVVLKEVARKLQERLHRKTDIVARLGGEEIGIAIDSKDVKEVLSQYYPDLKPGEPIHFRVLVTYKDKEIWVKISGGAVETDPAQETYKDAMNRADKLLYQAKRSGKDQIIIEQSNIAA